MASELLDSICFSLGIESAVAIFWLRSNGGWREGGETISGTGTRRSDSLTRRTPPRIQLGIAWNAMQAWAELLVPKRDHWIHAHRPPCWKV